MYLKPQPQLCEGGIFGYHLPLHVLCCCILISIKVLNNPHSTFELEFVHLQVKHTFTHVQYSHTLVNTFFIYNAFINLRLYAKDDIDSHVQVIPVGHFSRQVPDKWNGKRLPSLNIFHVI